MTAPALELVSVTAGYGDAQIVHDFSARLQAGTITTLIGGNGAGKSTLLRAIYGTNRFFSGQIVFKGETIERLPPWERLKRGVGFVPQGRCNFPAMSVAEKLIEGGTKGGYLDNAATPSTAGPTACRDSSPPSPAGYGRGPSRRGCP